MALEQLLLQKISAIDRRLEMAIGLLERLDGREQERAEADGPVPSDKFRLKGVDYYLSISQWRLLASLWGQEALTTEDVLEKVYDHDHEKTDSALFSLCNRLNKALADQSCPVSVCRKGGYLSLHLSQRE